MFAAFYLAWKQPDKMSKKEKKMKMGRLSIVFAGRDILI